MWQGRIPSPQYTKVRIGTWLLDFDDTSQDKNIVHRIGVWVVDTGFQLPVAAPLSLVMIEQKGAQPERAQQFRYHDKVVTVVELYSQNHCKYNVQVASNQWH